jgi:hypothetical protein
MAIMNHWIIYAKYNMEMIISCLQILYLILFHVIKKMATVQTFDITRDKFESPLPKEINK